MPQKSLLEDLKYKHPEYSSNSNIRSQANIELLNLHRTHNNKSGSNVISGASSNKQRRQTESAKNS